MWEEKRWPIRNGIYFADETVVLMDVSIPWKIGDETPSATISNSIKLNELEEFQKNIKTRIGQSCEQSYPKLNLLISCGGGSHGSEGFIAMTQITTSNLVWLAYFDCSNPFEKVSLSDGVVTAVSNLGHKWQLPLEKPETLKINL